MHYTGYVTQCVCGSPSYCFTDALTLDMIQSPQTFRPPNHELRQAFASWITGYVKTATPGGASTIKQLLRPVLDVAVHGPDQDFRSQFLQAFRNLDGKISRSTKRFRPLWILGALLVASDSRHQSTRLMAGAPEGSICVAVQDAGEDADAASVLLLSSAASGSKVQKSSVSKLRTPIFDSYRKHLPLSFTSIREISIVFFKADCAISCSRWAREAGEDWKKEVVAAA